jgi:hypothetical protein
MGAMGARLVLLRRLLLLRVHVDHEVVAVLATWQERQRGGCNAPLRKDNANG